MDRHRNYKSTIDDLAVELEGLQDDISDALVCIKSAKDRLGRALNALTEIEAGLTPVRWDPALRVFVVGSSRYTPSEFFVELQRGKITMFVA